MSAPWNPSTPLIKGNMSTLISNIVRTMEIMDIKLFKAIVIVLKRQIGVSKYVELLTQNVSNGSNDQKRLVLMVAQAYRNSKKRPKRVENNLLYCNVYPCSYPYLYFCLSLIFDSGVRCAALCHALDRVPEQPLVRDQ